MNRTPQKSSSRIVWVDYLETLAIILVVAYHCTSYIGNNFLADTHGGFFLYYLLRSIAAVCVPLFFLTNGFLLLSRPFDFKRHLSKILKFLFITIFWYEIISQEEGRGGINATVNVQVISPGYNGWNMSMDVKAYDANNMELWEKKDAEFVSAGFKVWCGPEVTRLVLRIRQPNNADDHFTVSVNWVDGVRT